MIAYDFDYHLRGFATQHVMFNHLSFNVIQFVTDWKSQRTRCRSYQRRQLRGIINIIDQNRQT